MKCAMCGKHTNLQVHHLLCGSQRAKADEYGLVIHLCADCHRKVHNTPELMKYCRMYGQKKFEEKHSRELFVREFGRSYL